MRSTESETMKEWENQQQSAPAIPPLQPLNQFGDSRYAGGIHDGAAAAGVGGALYVKVMTDEQLEMLRSQIAIYTSICEELVEMHKNATARQDLSGVRLGNLYCDPLVSSAGHKIVARQRWTPTPVQLQILERIFEQGIGTPSKQKIREIAAELSQHGQISETNVYNWFQNRRARSKRKQINPASNNAESEVEADAESPKEKIPISENFQPQHDSAAAEDYSYQGQEMSSEIHSIDPLPNNAETMFPSNECVRASESLGQLSFYESVMEQPRLDQFMGKMEVPGNYSPYQPGENYSMTG